ncbi:MAG: dihydroneopterin aldolase [Cyanobacteria bacterium P01_F01_bin.153]
MDILHVNGIRAYGYTGYFVEEQQLGQWFEVDLSFWLDLVPAGRSDELTDTLDYSTVAPLVQNLVKTSKFKTIERLAEAIATAILDTKKIDRVKVCLTKCQPPIPDFSGEIRLEIVREKNSRRTPDADSASTARGS